MSMIEDGTGSKRKAEVNSRNQLEVKAVVEAELNEISEKENKAFIWASGNFTNITTTGTEHAILHLKNTDVDRDLHITSIRTCGTQVQKWKLYRDSTGGTLITDEVLGSVANMKIGDPTISESVSFKGDNGKTISGGVMIEHWINGIGHSTNIYSGSLILKSGKSIQLTVELDTAGEICTRILGYFKEDNA